MEDKGKESRPVFHSCLSQYVDRGSPESHRYYLARRTAMEMLRDRGYSVPAAEIRLSLEEFRAAHGQNPDPDRLLVSAIHRSDPSKRITVIFCGPDTVKANVIRNKAAEILSQESLTGLIMVLQSHITNQALRIVEGFPFKVELFQITDLLVNITKHVLMPKHRILTDQEKQALLKKFSIETKQLPRILKQDAVARYYGYEKGQVIKITYSGEITESSETYRCVW